MKLATLLHGNIGDLYTYEQKQSQIRTDSKYDVNFGSRQVFVKGLESYKKYSNVDYFIHSWSTHLKQEIETEYKPIKSLIEQQVDFTKDYTEGKDSGTKTRYHVTKSRFYSLNQSIKLFLKYIEESHTLYDFVLLSRFDLIFHRLIDFNQLNPDSIHISKWIIDGKQFLWDTKVHDYWFTIPQSTLADLSSLIDTNIDLYLEQSMTYYGPSAHHVLKLLFKDLNIPVNYTLEYHQNKFDKNDFNLVRDIYVEP